MSKIIGIPGWNLGENSFGCTKHYLSWIAEFGTPRILMPQDDIIKLDLLILPGGADLSPSSYGEVPGFYTSNHDTFKEYFYANKLQQYIDNDTPIFGICLGFQMLNAKFGGKLTQDLPGHPNSPDRFQVGHKIKFVLPGTKGTMEVNSHHHQGVLESQVAPGFKVLAVEDFKKEDEGVDKVVEAIVHETKPIHAVQWHPEEWRDQISADFVKHLMG